jgi:hypothetical protein
VAKLRGRISVSKRARQNSDLERFDLKKLDDLEVEEKYKVEISNRFAALQKLDESFDIDNGWESIRENIKTSAKDNLGYQKLKHNKPCFGDECSNLIDQRTQDRLQWLQNSSQINGHNLQNLRHNVHGVHDVRQMDIYTAEPLVPEPTLVKVEIAIGKMKSYKSSGTNQIPVELIKTGGEKLYSEIHRHICCIWNKEELSEQWKESIIVSIHKKGDKIL